MMQLAAPRTPMQADSGDVAVIQDDGTLITEARNFNLSGTSFIFKPAASGDYTVSATSTLYAGGGTQIVLADDDTSLQSLGFSFPFYGKSYTLVQVNSDGNLTFGQGDILHSARDLGRFTSGPPRIGPLFVDLDPPSGRVSVRADAYGVAFIWDKVPNLDLPQPNSFSVKLYRNGDIEFVYGDDTTTDAVVGIAPGSGIGDINAVDFAADLPTGNLSGTISEVFSETSTVIEPAVAKAFYRNHPDSFDQIVLFLGFGYDLGNNAFAYEINVKNNVTGIALDFVDDPEHLWGSNGRLCSFVNMGSLNGIRRYPADPNQVFVGTNSTISILGQEAGHQFLAFTPWRDGSFISNTILGRDMAHWSFFFNSFASVMEGNLIRDNGGTGNSRFLTIAATSTYSPLDQYLMGLVGKEAVPPSFVVENPSGTAKLPASNPSVGIYFGGNRRDVTIDNIVAANGDRVPSVYQAPKICRQAFVLLTPKGQTATSDQIAKVQRIRDAWVAFYNGETGGRGWSVTDLQDSAATTPAQIFFPSFQGDSGRYTGIAVANWGSTPADVMFTAYNNDGSRTATPDQIINPHVVTIAPGAQIGMLAEQIHGLSLSDPRSGWVQARSTSSQVSSFFLDGDVAQTFLSGATAGGQKNQALCFTRAQVGTRSTPGNGYRNLINIVNPNSVAAQLSLRLLEDSGNIRQANLTIPPNGRTAQDLPAIFPGVSQIGTGYVSLTSDQGVVGYQSIDTGTTLFSLPAQAAANATKLYSAQFASGPAGAARYFTELNLINTSSQDRTVQVLLVGDDGTPANVQPNPAIVPVRAASQKRLRGEQLFGLPDAASSATLVQGSLALSVDGTGIVGDVLFGDAVGGTFMAGLVLDGVPASSVVLPHVAQGFGGGTKPYFTGIALYNPNSKDAGITIDVYSEQGVKTGTASIPLRQGGRMSKTLPELIPALVEQARGYIRISSTVPVVGYEIFGDQALTFIAPVPAQPAVTPLF